jgi:rubrerythrin
MCGNVQIPSLPLKGPKPFEAIINDICKAIEGEVITADFYCHLLKEAPNKLHQEFIEQAYRDELEHIQILSKLYYYYTECEPKYELRPIHHPCYKEGLLIALKGELETIEFYRDIQLYTMDQVIIDTFYMIMVDELTHATMFSTLFNTCPNK